MDVSSVQVEIDSSFIAFDRKLIEEVARNSDRAAPTGEEIKALWRQGKGRLVATAKTITRSGVNSITKGVGEVIYPTEFEPSLPPEKSEPAWENLDVLPSSLETRETGMIANVTPVVGPDGYTIDLTMVPEFCELLGMDDVGISKTQADGRKASVHLPQPRFHSRNTTTSIMVWDSRTLVAAGMPNSDGTEITYLFLTARLLDPAGQPIRAPGAGRASQPAAIQPELRKPVR